MQGISRGGIEHKVSLYADDLLVYLYSPDKSIPLILSVLTEFGHISGYKLNLQKSEFMPVNATAIAYPLSKLPFRTSLDHFKYLGVSVTKNYFTLTFPLF